MLLLKADKHFVFTISYTIFNNLWLAFIFRTANTQCRAVKDHEGTVPQHRGAADSSAKFVYMSQIEVNP